MSKLAILRLLDGDLEQGVRVVLTISTLQNSEGTASNSAEISGALPANPNLGSTIKQWQSNYRSLGTTRMRPNEVIIDKSIKQQISACQKLDQELRLQLNTWLSSPSFRSIRDKWLEELMKGEVRILIRASNQSLLKLPWHLWDLVERNPQAEVALSAFDSEPIVKPKMPTLRDKVKVLAILGDRTGIDIEKDRQLLQNLENLAGAEISFLDEKERREINAQLWEQSWDILFFAGHSRTEGKQGRIYINKTDSLTIEQLRYGLKKAVDKGLQLAIFNSCDGMGLAFELQQLQIPQVIVMREPVPDEIAQEFLRYFLPAFASDKPLYLAEREARLRLHGREDKFPGASWLPVIFQSPSVTPPTWAELGRRPTTLCPYRGLFAFREEDAPFFHGRESFTQILVEAIQKHPLVSVIGASGSGKSSVVFAGLVAELRQRGSWQIAALRPGQRPFQALAKAWVMLRTPNQPQTDQLRSVLQLAETWRTDKKALPTAIEEAVWESPETKLLIVIDQFEELYTQCQDEQERQAFIDRLIEVAALMNVSLVLTLRTDFLGQALAYRPLADVLQHSNRLLGSMSRTELQAAIAQPAALLDVTLEEGLTERMTEAVSSSKGNLPLLEFALQELWIKQRGIQLTNAVYDEIGGLEAALARHAEQVYSKLNESEKEQARQVFLQLVRPGEDTRRVATRAEIGVSNWELVTRLASDRLVVTGQNAIANTETVELVHEALIQKWSRLRSWIKENRDFRLWQERLRGAIQQWETSNRDEGALLRGKPLNDAEERFQNHSEELTAEQEFITASLELREREKEKLSRQRKRTITGLTGGLVGALGLAAIAGVGWQLATNAATSDRIKVLVLESQKLFELSGAENNFDKRNSTSSKDSSLVKEKDAENAKKEKILLQEASLKAIKAGRELQNASGVETGTRFQVLEALRRVVGTEEKPVEFNLPECEQLKRGPFSLTWTSDRKTIACVNYDGTVRLWDGQTGKKIGVFKGDSEWVDAVAFSPNGKIGASGTVDGTVKLWERTTGKEIRSLRGHMSQVRLISFSPDGQTLVAANYDGTMTVWEVATGKELQKLSGHSDIKYSEIQNILFSPNGQFIASQGQDNTLKLWKVSTGKELKTFLTEEQFNDPAKIDFSSNSQTLIYSTGHLNHQNVRFWNIAEKREIKNILVSGNPFFSPDGQVIAVINAKKIDFNEKFSTTSTTGTVSLLDTSTGKKLKTLNNLPPGVPAKINFSPDSSLIAIYTYDNKNGSYLGPVQGSKAKVTFCRRDGKELRTIEQQGELFGLNFSPDSRKIAIASYGLGNAEGSHIIFKLWDVSMGRQLKTLFDEPILFSETGLSVGLGSLFSPDGKMIAVVSSSGIAKFFDSSTGQELNIPNISPSHDLDQPPRISKDGKSIITLRTDGSIRYRTRSTGKETKLNRWDSVLVSAAHISDDNKTITTVNWYGKLQKRELATGKTLDSTNLPFHKFASHLDFSRDGRRLAAAMSNDTVKIWDTTTSKEIITLKEYASNANLGWVKDELRFSPDGKMVAALSGENVLKNGANLELWEVSSGESIQFPEVISGVQKISFSPNTDELAILKIDNTIQLWKLSTHQLIKTLRSPSLDRVNRIQFSQDGKLLFIQGSGKLSNNLALLDIAADQEIASFKLSAGRDFDSVDFSADGKTLVLQSDNQFTFFNLDLEKLLGRACNISRDYLRNNPNLNERDERDRHMCDSIS
jgi:WD40 repeat protein